MDFATVSVPTSPNSRISIERWGIVEAFWGSRRKYLHVDGRQYWHMGNASSNDPDKRPTLINRAWIEVGNYRDHARALGYDGERRDAS